jgi:hypothetical protein
MCETRSPVTTDEEGIAVWEEAERVLSGWYRRAREVAVCATPHRLRDTEP